jgi:VanZ family protein
MPPASNARRPAHGLARAALLVSLALIAAATLLPIRVPAAGALPKVSAPVWPVDVLRNIVLFLPLGVAFALRGTSLRRTLGLAFALAVAIEIAQLGIPGRFSAPSDPLADAAGAWLGWWLARSGPGWLRPNRRLARRLELAGALAVAAVLAATALLTEPAPTPGVYAAHWIPDLPHLFPYTGSLDAARLAGRPLPQGLLGDSGAIQRLLAADFALELEGRAGAPTAGLGGIFLLSDEQEREILIVGVDREDLVFRYRSRAGAIGLEPAVLRMSQAWRAVAPGSPFVVEVSRAGPSWCLALGAERTCGLGFHAGSGWTLFAPVLMLDASGVSLFEVGWIAALFLPLGLWGRADVTSLLALALAAAPLLLLGAAGLLLPTPVGLGLAAPGGWLVGRGVGGWLERSAGAR